jgi:hypothetical protein
MGMLDTYQAKPKPVDPTGYSSQAATQSAVTELSKPTAITAADGISENSGNVTTKVGTQNTNATVEGRLGGLLSRDGDYMKRAESKGIQLANDRGFSNSSMAVGSAYGAAIDAALPIASQDAGQKHQLDLTNTGAENETRRLNAGTELTRDQYNSDLEQDTNQFNATRTDENERINAAAQNQSATNLASEKNKNNFQMLQANVQAQLAGLDQEYTKELSSMENMYDITKNLDTINGAIYQQLVSGMSTILANVDDPGVAKQQIDALMRSAGAEFEFSNGVSQGTAQVSGDEAPLDPTPTPAPAPAPETRWTGGDR